MHRAFLLLPVLVLAVAAAPKLGYDRGAVLGDSSLASSGRGTSGLSSSGALLSADRPLPRGAAPASARLTYRLDGLLADGGPPVESPAPGEMPLLPYRVPELIEVREGPALPFAGHGTSARAR
jgi:hypothetical protein